MRNAGLESFDSETSTQKAWHSALGTRAQLALGACQLAAAAGERQGELPLATNRPALSQGTSTSLCCVWAGGLPWQACRPCMTSSGVPRLNRPRPFPHLTCTLIFSTHHHHTTLIFCFCNLQTSLAGAWLFFVFSNCWILVIFPSKYQQGRTAKTADLFNNWEPGPDTDTDTDSAPLHRVIHPAIFKTTTTPARLRLVFLTVFAPVLRYSVRRHAGHHLRRTGRRPFLYVRSVKWRNPTGL